MHAGQDRDLNDSGEVNMSAKAVLHGCVDVRRDGEAAFYQSECLSHARYLDATRSAVHRVDRRPRHKWASALRGRRLLGAVVVERVPVVAVLAIRHEVEHPCAKRCES
jgi:hypothetical protein